MTYEKLATITARVDATTEGPWEQMTDKLGLTFLLAPDERLGSVIVARITGGNITADAEFIAHAAGDIRDLLADNAVLRRALAAYVMRSPYQRTDCSGYYACNTCGADEDEPHTADCLWVQASKAIGTASNT